MSAALPAPSNIVCGLWKGNDVAMSYRGLCTTSQSLGAVQPIVSEDSRLVVIFDGYLANYCELRTMLEQSGARLRSDADAELVLHAFSLWGRACPRQIDGEFAFAIWDTSQRELFCARDHQGLRPFYYHYDDTQIAFGSSTGAVLAALARKPHPNAGFMAEIMSDRWYTLDETVWREVKRLPPAHSLHYSGGRLTLERYWTLSTEVTLNYRRDEEYFEHYREIFAGCVKSASRTNSTLAVEVSGGLDSSAVFAMADALHSAGELGAPDIKGYSIYGPPGSASDERHFVDAVARKTGRTISSFPLFIPPLAWFNRQIEEHIDVPTYPNGAMSINLDRQLIADGCRVKLTGIGGDQWLDGSRRYYDEALARADPAAFLTSLRADLLELGVVQTAPLLLRALVRSFVPKTIRALLRPHSIPEHGGNTTDSFWLDGDLQEELDRRKAAYLATLPGSDRDRYKIRKLAFPNLPHALELLSRQLTSFGVEARHPLLSRRFIEFSATTPERMRLRGSTGKYMHRMALTDLLPSEVSRRTDKGEFSVTFEKLLPVMCKRLSCERATAFNSLVNDDALHKLIDNCRKAAFDDAPFWELWGYYVISTLFNQLER